jgi:hypothetical protein
LKQLFVRVRENEKHGVEAAGCCGNNGGRIVLKNAAERKAVIILWAFRAEGAVRAISHGIIIISGGGGADFCADERANEFIHRRRDTRALARCRCHNDDNSSPALFAFALY